jgi:hypothetical protein
MNQLHASRALTRSREVRTLAAGAHNHRLQFLNVRSSIIQPFLRRRHRPRSRVRLLLYLSGNVRVLLLRGHLSLHIDAARSAIEPVNG